MPAGVYVHKKGELSSRWKGGKPKCIDCGKELSLYHGITRCRNCADKFKVGKNHPFYGKAHSEETKEKISKSKKDNPTLYWLGKKHPPKLKEFNCKICGKLFQAKTNIQFYCNNCKVEKKNEWKKKYWLSEKGKEKSRKYFHAEENRIKYQARWWINEMIRKGKIIKPEFCQGCNEKKRLYGHHYLGYEKEHRLDVQWLCSKCHRKVHGKEEM